MVSIMALSVRNMVQWNLRRMPIYRTNVSQAKTCGGFFLRRNFSSTRQQLEVVQAKTQEVLPIHKSQEIINNFFDKNTHDSDLREDKMSKLSTEQIQELTRNLSSCFETLEAREKTALFQDGNLTINHFIDSLRLECVKRLKSKNVTPENYISTNNDNFLKVLDLCEYWLHLENRKTKNSFVFWVVNDIGDSDNGKSMMRFKHFTVDGFVKFCRMMRHVSLADSFHKFYVLIKFLDLFDDMTERDIADVCSTIVHHQVHLGCEHPVNIMIKEKLVHYLETHIETMSARSLLKICTALNPQLEYNFPQQLVDKMLKIQQRTVKIVEKFDTRTLIALLNVTNNNLLTVRNGVNMDLVDALVNRLCIASVEPLYSKDISILAFTISKQRDTPMGRYLLTKLTPVLVQYLLTKPVTNAKNVSMATLQMAHLGLYDHTLLDTLFSCPSVTHLYPDTGERALTRQLVYSGGYNHQAGLDKAAGDLIMLQGMVELEQPGYIGARITKDVEKCIAMTTGDSPLEIFKQMEADNPSYLTRKLAKGYFNNKNLEVYNELVKITGRAEMVWECYVLPCTTQVGYVVGLDDNGQFIDIGQERRNAPWCQVKQFKNSSTTCWFVVYLFHSLLKQRWFVRTGGEPVLQRLLSRLGVRGIIVNTEEWDDMDSEAKENYMKEMLTVK